VSWCETILIENDFKKQVTLIAHVAALTAVAAGKKTEKKYITRRKRCGDEGLGRAREVERLRWNEMRLMLSITHTSAFGLAVEKKRMGQITNDVGN
jgi:hypothetical protein